MAMHLFDGNREAAKQVYEELRMRENQRKAAIASGSPPPYYEGITHKDVSKLTDKELDASFYIAMTSEGPESMEKFAMEKIRRADLTAAKK